MRRIRTLFGLVPATALLASAVLTTVGPDPAGAVPSPDLVISQVYGGGGNTGAPYNADFIEIFNGGDAPRSLGGLSVQYASATGTGTFGASGLVALPAVDLAPGGYLLVGMTPGATGSPLPTPDATGTIGIGRSIRETPGATWILTKAALSVLWNVPYCLRNRRPVHAEDFELPLG